MILLITFYASIGFLFSILIESEGQIPSDSESREESLLTDEQLKWLVIIGGLAALVLLVIIQASCMVWRDKKNRTRNLHKVCLIILIIEHQFHD